MGGLSGVVGLGSERGLRELGADCRLGSGRWAKPMGYTCALLQPSRMGDLLGRPAPKAPEGRLNFVNCCARSKPGCAIWRYAITFGWVSSSAIAKRSEKTR